ncbi:hypothetical protein [Sulfurospirillum diekertiae]|uniref:Uncharacterized protein n=1 Tax=Sulfurospirillum diekertiae TaxID=1854492 RepID=A0AA92IY81_9BACT|nr:hypothetical protein [Sulfurospirillum diekertiae]MDD3343534.1 hypothetical protein [Sulfurospirillaceae bacterium]NCC19192.1 hypothetical protein [Bacteroidia bacterium]QIR75222.1 hypothetical protein FA584_02905 [Sulfurospirillum diekertiae]
MVKNIFISIVLTSIGFLAGYIVGGALSFYFVGKLSFVGMYIVAVPLLFNWLYFKKNWLLNYGALLFIGATLLGLASK